MSGIPAVKAGFGEVDVVLDVAEDVVADGAFVAESDDGFAFGFESLAGELLEVVRIETVQIGVGSLFAQLADAVGIFGAEAFDIFRPGAI